jgi:hypothetical protein
MIAGGGGGRFRDLFLLQRQFVRRKLSGQRVIATSIHTQSASAISCQCLFTARRRLIVRWAIGSCMICKSTRCEISAGQLIVGIG